MAIKKIVTITATDDLDGTGFDPEKGEGVIDFPFSVNGEDYVLDLTTKNHAKLTGILAAYTEKARRPPMDKATYMRKAGEWNKRFRDWAERNGHGARLNTKGKFPDDLVEIYVKATEDPRPEKPGEY